MTSDSFLAALKRLFARRGKCSHIYSDNGTNFVGASKKLDKDLQQAIKSNVSAVCALEAEGIKWHFIPPASPHFGGLWESAVKSIKHHLKRVVGENKLTYEELSTLLTQIEGILNSRPLCANVDDNDILTPGHFLIGHAIIDYPEAVDDMNISSLNRWKIIQAMKKHFWKRWKEEYLTNLQQRYKWKGVQANVKEGQVVIVKNEETYPGRWPLGKIIDVHPGKDNLVRVVSVKTQNGTIKRPIQKLCVLEGVHEQIHVAENKTINVIKRNWNVEFGRWQNVQSRT
ncbi:uncharacterized protein LOC119666318 [Teleopsis dalmanni]|uniref:uncharacterized protein LOC119666318 n=1 Tax=Teleopsis dalmanni TaxID=139649 RepID=UPI0018CD990E|nr:uncharacterized protein LOC119666318 [Teleopsis dalmanni]